MACKLEEAVQEINKLLALPAVNKEKILLDKLNLAKQSIEAQMKLLQEKAGQSQVITKFTVTPKAKPDMIKAKFKANKATKYIGYGKTGSSTELYAKQLSDQGMSINVGEYNKDDVVFVSVNGTPNRQDYINTVKQATAALDSGAIILTDSEEYLAKSTYNKGEQELAKYLLGKGYIRTTSKENSEVAEWSKDTDMIKVVPSSGKPTKALFSSIKEVVRSQGKIWWGKEVAWFGPIGYAYSGKKHEQADMPNIVRKLADRAAELAGKEKGYYNSSLINIFPKGKGITAHPDNEVELRLEDNTIGSIIVMNLGGSAAVDIIDNASNKVVESVVVKDGDVYIMPEGDFQDKYKHAIGNASDERVSITFRHIPKHRLKEVKLKGTDLNENIFSEALPPLKEVSTQDKVYQLLSIYKDTPAPKIGGGMIDNTIIEKYERDEDKPNAEMIKGSQDSTLKDMLPYVDGRTVNAWSKAADKWYKEQNRKPAVRKHVEDMLKIIAQIENEPKLIDELNWGNTKQEVGKMTTNKINEMALKCAK